MKAGHHKPGSVFGAMLLVAGSCIGAGMLALPIMTGLAGFFPSLAALFAAWAFMTFTGLLLVEICGWEYGQRHLLTLAKESIGETGRVVGWVTYLFLFYSLLVAYIAASGNVFSEILAALFCVQVAPWIASLFFTAFFGLIVYMGTRPVDLCNRILMVGLIATYLGMVGLGLFKIDPKLFLHLDPKYTLYSLPVLTVSFGFQNMIPSLTTYLRGDLKRVRTTVIGGSLLTLFVYLVWSALVLGTVPIQGPHGILESYLTGQEATSALRHALGCDSVVMFAQGFAFFAIVTSFLAQGLSLTHFWADGLKKEGTDHAYFQQKYMGLLCLLALVPPLLLALYIPELFYKALNFAGGICAMILFGLIPISMAWVGRYHKNKTSYYHVKGGKISLIIALLFTCIVIGREIVNLIF